VTIKDHLKKIVDDVKGAASDEVAAHDEKAEADTEADSHVAGSRASDEGEANDGPYVGRTTPQFDSEVEESGAEARSEAARQAPEASGD
jgi:hypothetical protein